MGVGDYSVPDLGEGEPAEELEVHDLGQQGVDAGQRVHGLPDARELARVRGGVHRHAVQGRYLELPAPLARLAVAHMVDDQVAHDARGVGHEAGAVGERAAFAPRHVEVGLVQQGRGAEREVRALAGELAPGQPVQLLVQRPEQGIHGRRIAALGGGDERGQGTGHGTGTWG